MAPGSAGEPCRTTQSDSEDCGVYSSSKSAKLKNIEYIKLMVDSLMFTSDHCVCLLQVDEDNHVPTVELFNVDGLLEVGSVGVHLPDLLIFDDEKP
jgi:hypothetical protein